jgi:ATP-binding cassette subfamily C protein
VREALSARPLRTPMMLQQDLVECGAVALGIILAHHGRRVPLAELRRQCGVSRDGSRASRILRAARHYGLEAKGYKKEPHQLRALPLPCIVFWQFNHFLVVEGFGRHRVYLNDPATGPRTVSEAEFDESFTGVVLAFTPGPAFSPGGSSPDPLAGIARRLGASLDLVAYCLVAGLLFALMGLAIPAAGQIFVDEVLVRGQRDWLTPLVWSLLLIALLRAALMHLQLAQLRLLRFRLAAVMSTRFTWHALRLGLDFFAQRSAGDLAGRVALNDRVARTLAGQIATAGIGALMVLFYTLVMVQYDGLLTALAVGFAALNGLAFAWVSRRRVHANLRLAQEYGAVEGTAIAALQDIETVKACGLESETFARWAGHYTRALAARQDLDLGTRFLGAMPAALASLSSVALLVVGGLRVMDGSLSLGMLVAFQAMLQAFQEPLRQLVNCAALVQELEGNLLRLDDILLTPAELPAAEEPTAGCALPGRPAGWVEICGLTFGYNPQDEPLVQDLHFTASPGERVALVGRSGSGKSTIARLIAGLYTPWSGEVRLDGRPLAALPRALVADAVALVDQQLHFFGGTLRDNLTLWDATVDAEALVRACKDAEIYETILALPGGFDAELAEGGRNFSGGERQRLEIARALVGDPAVLVLDEATSALDAETERRVLENLKRRGCTCLLIAHRLSTVRDADEILVVDNGQLVARGTHERLWYEGGLYADLVRTEGEALAGEAAGHGD